MKKYKLFIVIPLITSLILFTFWTIQVQNNGNDSDIFTWWTTLLATIISIVIAAIVGIRIYFYQKKYEDEKRLDQLITLLKTELHYILDEVKNENKEKIKLDTFTHETNVVITFLQPLIIEESAKSGLFNVSISEKLFQLSSSINSYNIRISFYLSLFTKNSIVLSTSVNKEEEKINKIIENISLECNTLLNDL